MDDIIYIVLGLLYLVFQFYISSRRKKAKKEQEERIKAQRQAETGAFVEEASAENIMAEEQGKLPPEFERMMDKLFPDEEKIVQEVSKPKYQSLEEISPEVTQEELRRFSGQSLETIDIGKEAEKRREKYKPSIIVEDLVEEVEYEEEGIDIQEITENFDLRNAVIYNEILNPPYM